MKTKRFQIWLSMLVLAAFLCMPAAYAVGRADAYVHTVYNEQNGLPTGEANAVLQTADGYLWIGSYGGLIRYNGSTFRNFSREGALTSSSIRSLFEDSAGRLWIGSNDAGVFLYENGTFITIPCTEEHNFLCIRDFAEGPDGTVYAASNSGIGVIRNRELVPYTAPQVAGQPVYSLGVDSYGRLWGAMNAGECVVLQGETVQGVVPSSLIFENDAEIYCLKNDAQGNLYFGTSGTALAKVSFRGEALRADQFTATRRQTKATVTHNQIRVTAAGDVLVAGQRGFAWFTPDGTLREFSDNEHAAALNSAAMDYEGNIWLASSNEGLIKYNLGSYISPNETADLSGLAVNAVAYAHGRYYLASDQGLQAFDRDWNPVQNRVTALLSGMRVRCAIGDRAGRLWCATYSKYGVVCYDPNDGSLQCFNQQNGLGSDRARVLLELSDGSIAVGTQDGLAIIRGDAVERTYGKEDGLDTLAILCLTETPDGTLLAGSDGGGIYAIHDGTVTNHGFSEGLNEGVVLRILVDEDDGGWFVSAGSSLYHWDHVSFQRLDNFRKEAGSIFDLYDRDGKLWLLQNSGVVAVDKAQLLTGEQSHTVLYGTNHGLTGSLNANTWNYLSPSGELYIATRSGVSIFGFHGVKNHLPRVIISSIRVDGKSYEHPEELTLDSTAQRVTIEFVALSFAGTSDLQLAYQLEGFDADETMLTDGISGSISYTNLPGGTYTFRVRAFDPQQPDEQVICQTSIQKEKVFYERPGFWILFILAVVLAAGGVVLIYFRFKVRRLRRRQREYQQIVEQSLQTFAKTIDAKDPYTNGHSIRVAHYSREIARRMGLPEQEQERIYYVAMLHDIGKIGVPDQILNKNGKLTAEELQAIRRHPLVGGDILKNFTAIDGISDGARYHHERFDGKGYCEGKSGQEIPLVARIIGVADSYDAMSSDRCYRKALPQTVVAEELRKGSGAQFDPQIVPIMLDMMQDGTAPIELDDEKPSSQEE